MYVINIGDDGHEWQESPKDQHPFNGKFNIKKMFCVFCGAKAYTVGSDRLSLGGEYYNGEIRQCPGGRFKKDLKKQKKKDKKKNKVPLIRRTSSTLIRRTSSSTIKRTK